MTGSLGPAALLLGIDLKNLRAWKDEPQELAMPPRTLKT